MDTAVCNGMVSATLESRPADLSSDDDVEIIEEKNLVSPPAKRYKAQDSSVTNQVLNNDSVQNSESQSNPDRVSPEQVTPEQAEMAHQITVEQSGPGTGQSNPVDNNLLVKKHHMDHLIIKQSRPTQFLFGPYVPIIRTEKDLIIDTLGIHVDYHSFTCRGPVRKRLVGEISSHDSIIEVPSLVTPLMLKKQTVWPPKCPPDQNISNEADEVEVIKVVNHENSKSYFCRDEPRYRKPEQYIKETVINSLTNNSKRADQDGHQESILAIEDYHKSSAGELLIGIGLSLVNEFTMEERCRKVAHKMRKGEPGLISEYESLKKNLTQAKSHNRYLKPDKILECHMCKFKTGFANILEHHMETPHKSASRFLLCNHCGYKTKDPTQIVSHNLVIHRKYRCHNEKPMFVHTCRYCTFETNSKRKYTSHIQKCERLFQPETNLALTELTDFPAVTSKCITQLDVITYETSLKALRLAAYNPHQIKVSSTPRNKSGLPILLIPRSSPAATLLDNVYKQATEIPLLEAANPYNNPNAIIGRGSTCGEKLDLSQNKSLAPNLLRLLATNSARCKMPAQKATLLQHPKPQSMFVNAMSLAKNTQNIVMPPPNRHQQMKTTEKPVDHAVLTMAHQSKIGDTRANQSANTNGDGTFVICEICDAYIDNISFFKSHMQWVHKVKIHAKVLETLKPPLNCQKCNWRYFTDQGLERHLLGSHGLITPNMQELVDDEKDSGRCTICGVRCASKLVSHIKDIHKISLKPAQLSYKCTVCSATFSMYCHFENHVYRVHGCS